MDIVVGDKVKISQWYLANYPEMEKRTEQLAEVVEICPQRSVNIDSLDARDGTRAMYLSKYGKLSVFPIYSFFIRYEGDTSLFLVSPFGYDKA
jgi:hypothetical protein